jgi:hypothetical protein
LCPLQAQKAGDTPGKGMVPGKIIMCSSEQGKNGRIVEMWIKLTEEKEALISHHPLALPSLLLSSQQLVLAES